MDSNTWVIFLGMSIILIVFVVLGIYFTPTAKDCRDYALDNNIPCNPSTVRWDDDECECNHIDGYEIEFNLE